MTVKTNLPPPVQRIATLADADDITALINLAFRKAEGFFIESDRIGKGEVQQLIQTGTFLLTYNDETLTGCVYVERRGERSYLGLLSVDPRHQQLGLGSLLMNAAEDYCRELGSQFMDILIVNLRQELPDFYRRRGYVETGTSPFPTDIETKLPVHFITMAKQLAGDETSL